MKQAVALALAALFIAGLIHFFYAEDHCPVHCPCRSGQVAHAHPHHPGASVCLCFWSSLMAPEAAAPLTADMFLAFMTPPAADPILGRAAADITPPPRSLLV